MQTLTQPYFYSAINNADTDDFFQQRKAYRTLSSCEKYEDIEEIQYGINIYPLRNAVKGNIEFPDEKNNMYRFVVGKRDSFFVVGTFDPIVGTGKTPDEARENWKYEFHKRFQELSAKLDWERTETETSLWKIIEEVVDIPKHRELTPLELEQTGRIVENNEIPTHQREILWLDESRSVVDCRGCPSDLLKYASGQYFRASVLLYKTGKLIICAVRKTNYQNYTEEEVDEFWESMPTTKELPDSAFWK